MTASLAGSGVADPLPWTSWIGVAGSPQTGAAVRVMTTLQVPVCAGASSLLAVIVTVWLPAGVAAEAVIVADAMSPSARRPV